MGFLSPLFLGGLLAASIPFYVHLLRQHKTVPRPFSSLMLFEKRIQSSVKHRRLKYIALLLLRLAIILLLALMFANPFINRSPEAAGQGKKLLIVAVDNSFSMRTEGRLERAKQEAKSALGSFRPGDTGQVLTFASGVQLRTQAIDNLSELQAAVDAIQPGDGRSAYGELTRMLRSLAPRGDVPVEVHVVSDMQKTSLPSPFSELALNPNTRLVLHSMADSREPNWYVESVNAPRSVFQPKKVRVQATIAGAGTPRSDKTASLALNGKVLESRKVTIPENGRASVEFFLADAAYGLNRGEVRIENADRLKQDDAFPFAFERKEASRILFVHEAGRPRALRYVQTALESTPDVGFTVDGVTAEFAANVSPDKYAFVVLSDVSTVPSQLEDALTKYVRRGGSLLVALGGFGAARGKVPVAGLAIAEARYASREGERFQAAGSVDETHPSVSRAAKFENVKFYQTARLSPTDARVIARLTDGTPLLLEKKMGEGRVMIFASTLDNIANDLPLRASFIPFLEQTAVYLSGGEPSPAHYAVDSFLELRSSRDAGSTVEVIGPDGKRALSLAEANSAQTFRLNSEGFYEVRRGNGRNELVPVHADRRESDLDLIPKETLALWQNTGHGSGSGAEAGATETKPFRLWWYFAMALLGAAVAESLVASRYLDMQEAEPAVRKQAA